MQANNILVKIRNSKCGIWHMERRGRRENAPERSTCIPLNVFNMSMHEPLNKRPALANEGHIELLMRLRVTWRWQWSQSCLYPDVSPKFSMSRMRRKTVVWGSKVRLKDVDGQTETRKKDERKPLWTRYVPY